MQHKVQTYIQQHQLLSPKGKVVIGVSGGTDSVVLLHVLMALGYKCVIAHCNFHLRMDESDRDEQFVRELANSLKVESYFVDFETTKHSELHKISIEMAARDLRYDWFEELRKKLNAQAIVVAHHADDSIETMLMNLVRGTGLRGLTGIQPRNNHVIRPLLCCTRLEIENYMILHDLQHVEDSTNATVDYKRNKFRNEIIPILEEVNPSVRQTLYDSIERFEGSVKIYQQAIEKIRNEIVVVNAGLVKMNIKQIKNQIDIPTVLYELLHVYGFSAALIIQIAEHLDSESGKIFFSETHRLLKDRNSLIISPVNNVSDQEFQILSSDIEIEQPFSMKINKMVIASDFRVSKEKNRVQFDASSFQFPLTLRRWKESDTFYPFGMNQKKKISDFFIDNKLSIFEKEQCWLLLSGNEIVWIVGRRTDNRFRVTEATKEIIEFII